MESMATTPTAVFAKRCIIAHPMEIFISGAAAKLPDTSTSCSRPTAHRPTASSTSYVPGSAFHAPNWRRKKMPTDRISSSELSV